MKHLLRTLKGQRGFTLIELVAVMAIMAVLVAVVAPSVTGARDASINAQVMQDATQVRSAATNFYKSQNEAEVRTPHSVDLVTKVNNTELSSTKQEVSSRWPEMYITQQGTPPVLANRTASSRHSAIFETAATVKVRDVALVAKGGSGTIPGAMLLGDYTAIDLAGLVSASLLAKTPAGSDTTSTAVGSLEVPNFLWLFEKVDSSADSTDDSREVAVFKLVKVVENEPVGGGAATTVDLTYERIF